MGRVTVVDKESKVVLNSFEVVELDKDVNFVTTRDTYERYKKELDEYEKVMKKKFYNG